MNIIEIKKLNFFSTRIAKTKKRRKRNNDVLSPLKIIIPKDTKINNNLCIKLFFTKIIIKKKV